MWRLSIPIPTPTSRVSRYPVHQHQVDDAEQKRAAAVMMMAMRFVASVIIIFIGARLSFAHLSQPRRLFGSFFPLLFYRDTRFLSGFIHTLFDPSRHYSDPVDQRLNDGICRNVPD
jgi:hypothetical protein